ncbi:MAG: GGDEF domain-containing protein [Xanthobacteraceae bacterium]
MVVVADSPAPDIMEALGEAGAFPVVESRWRDAPEAFVAVQPSAIVLAEPGPASDAKAADTLGLQIKTRNGPFIPLIGRTRGNGGLAISGALPIDADASANRLVARLRTALRVRSLHATVLRRMETFNAQGRTAPVLTQSDPIDDATVLVAGRGRSYPALAVAAGERMGLIGALSVETAARYLNSREVDGVIIGDGFSPKIVEALLTVLAENARFRDLPVAAANGDPSLVVNFGAQLVNLERVEGDPANIAEWMLPLVRLRAFDARLKRLLKSFDSEGVIDPQTGLLTRDAFWRELARALKEAAQRGVKLSLARFTFGPLVDTRIGLDTARLVSGIVRNIDFACQGADGSILCVFTGTDLRAAHVIARRIANGLRHTMLTSGEGCPKAEINITLGALKPTDTVDSLLERVGAATFAAD